MLILTSQIRTIFGRHCIVLYPESKTLNSLFVLILYLLCVLSLKLAKVVLFVSICVIMCNSFYMVDVVNAYFLFCVNADLNEIRPILPQLLDGICVCVCVCENFIFNSQLLFSFLNKLN